VSWRSLALALAVLLTAPGLAAAQYFGRNKVQYEDFDFRVLGTPHFDIHYYTAERDAARKVGRMAERWYDRLSQALGHTFADRVPIVLYASHSHFVQTTIVSEFLGDSVGGFTDHQKGRVVLPLAASLGETDHVLGHELVHAFQRDILRRNGRSMALLPLWFTEGMAEYLSLGGVDPNTAMWMRDGVDQKRLPTIEELDNPKWFPYRYGQSLWAYLVGRFGDSLPQRALASKAKGGATGRLADVTGTDVATLSKDWHDALRRSVESPERRRGEVTPPIISAARGGGRLNVGPALSPDGTRLVFLSERDQYSIDVFLADAKNGAIERKLVSTATDPHVDSLQFVESAGAWDPTGRRFALATLGRGRPAVTILDLYRGDKRTDYPFPDLDHVFNPAWSPDGTRVVFAALHAGTTDLYVVDLESGQRRQLTDDAYADLQPVWSPDGRTIAFVTDRFTSSLDDLTFGPYRLAALDVETGAIRALPAIPHVKHISPQWSGRTLYFVADADGVSNVFSMDLSTGAIHQVTEVPTGVSGITASSPALSVASEAGRLAYSVYHRGAYEIVTMNIGVRPQPSEWGADGAEPDHLVSGSDPHDSDPIHRETAPGTEAFQEKPYSRKLSLSGIGQPYLTAGGGPFGGFIRAGVAFSFADLLGDRELQSAVQVGGDRTDFAFEAAYINRRSRWNWGIVGAEIPALIGASQTTLGAAATVTRETDLVRQVHRQLAATTTYPFSSAQRFEVGGGLHTIAFDREVTSQRYSAVTGSLLDEQHSHVSAGRDVTLMESEAALVYDTAVFGGTAPGLGTRYRLGVAPTVGDLSLLTVTADYRRYVMPVRPFTIAMRIEHVGRYGHDASDARLLPLIWTLRDLVRGYDSLNVAAPDLAATRFLVSNVELRLPLIGSPGSIASGWLPIDGLVFADGGAFWNRQSRGTDSTGTVLRSIGAGVRLNAGGFVFEFDAARPLDAAGGWTLAVNFRPGF
jgi:hypothetical protein